MTDQTKDLETMEPEIEAMPGQEMAGIINKEQAQDVFWLADNIDKLIEAQKKIFYGILKITIPGDFVCFGSKDKQTAEIRGAGCERIARDLGVSFENWSAEKESLETGTDEKGDWFRYKYEVDAVWRSRRIRVFAVAGSRTAFFGKEDGAIKPIYEVDRNNVQKAARREAMKEGVKALFGLRHLDPEELENRGVKLVRVGGHTFKSKEEKAEEAKAVTVQIVEVVIAKQGKSKSGKDWTIYKIKDSEGAAYSTFSKSVAEEAKKFKGGAAVNLTWTQGQYGPEILSVNGIGSDSKGE